MFYHPLMAVPFVGGGRLLFPLLYLNLDFGWDRNIMTYHYLKEQVLHDVSLSQKRKGAKVTEHDATYTFGST